MDKGVQSTMKAEVVRSLVCAAFVGMGAFVSFGAVHGWMSNGFGLYSNSLTFEHIQANKGNTLT